MRRLFSTKVSDNALSVALFLLRVGAGFLMLANHGLDKLMHFAQRSSRFADPFGIGSTMSLSLTIFAEVFCAAFVILGLFTRLACIPLVIAMCVAFFYSNNGNYKSGELALLFLICFLAILVAGPGKASIDRLINK
jgi:putative oxidoreductase